MTPDPEKAPPIPEPPVQVMDVVQGLDVAIHASSLWDGLVFQRDSDALFRIWDRGGVELHDQMAELAMTDARLCEALYQAADSRFPGVYNEEVTEALGQLVAGHLVSTGDFPTEAEWQTTLGELALSFFAQGTFRPEEMNTLREVVARLLPHWQAGPSDIGSDASPSHLPFKPPPNGGHFNSST